MTGRLADRAASVTQGALLAAEEINGAGGVRGRSLRLVRADARSTGPDAVAALSDLLRDPEIRAVVGTDYSQQTHALLPVIELSGIPIMTGGTSYDLTHSGSRWVFRCRPHDGIATRVLVRFAVHELGLRRIAVVHTTDRFGADGRDFVVGALRDLHLEPGLVQRVRPGEQDFRGIIDVLRQSGVDGLVPYLASDLETLARQIDEAGVEVTWVGPAGLADAGTLKLAGESLHGSYAAADFHPDASPISKGFAAAYRARYGTDADSDAAWTYDAVHILAEAMRRAPDLAPERVRQAILSIRGFHGAEGEYSFDANGDGLSHYHIVRNDAGTIRLVKTLSVPPAGR